jgi:protein-disulfide isomerase
MEQTQSTKRDQRIAEQQARLHSYKGSGMRAPWVRKLAIWGSVVAIFALLIWGMSFLAKDPSDIAGVELAVPVSAADHQTGPTTAKATLVEYSDYQCPACGAYYPVIKQLQKDFGDKLNFVYRNFPLSQIHPRAELGARVAEAAGKQGKYWEMHDLLFEHQNDWVNGNDPQSVFVGYAQTLKINVDQFKKDLTNDEIGKHIQDDYAGGAKAGVNATPTFFLNGKALSASLNYDILKQNIEDALK